VGDFSDVIMAAYPSVGPAETDFDALVALVKGKKVKTEGVILVEHEADGEVKVSQTGDHLGRKGMGWGGGVGLVVGLFSPPLLASVVVGGAAGGLIGKFAEHRGEAGLEKGLGDKLRPGTAAIIAIIGDDDRLALSPATPPHVPGPAPRCRGSCRRTAMSPAGSASGTSRRTTSRGQRARSAIGRRGGALTTGGGSCPARPASMTRSLLWTTPRSACRRARTASSITSPTT